MNRPLRWACIALALMLAVQVIRLVDDSAPANVVGQLAAILKTALTTAPAFVFLVLGIAP